MFSLFFSEEGHDGDSFFLRFPGPPPGRSLPLLRRTDMRRPLVRFVIVGAFLFFTKPTMSLPMHWFFAARRSRASCRKTLVLLRLSDPFPVPSPPTFSALSSSSWLIDVMFFPSLDSLYQAFLSFFLPFLALFLITVCLYPLFFFL